MRRCCSFAWGPKTLLESPGRQCQSVTPVRAPREDFSYSRDGPCRRECRREQRFNVKRHDLKAATQPGRPAPCLDGAPRGPLHGGAGRLGRINIFEIAAFAKWPRGPCGWVEGFAKGHPVALNALLRHEGEPPAGTAGTAQRGLNTVSASSDFQQCSLCL